MPTVVSYAVWPACHHWQAFVDDQPVPSYVDLLLSNCANVEWCMETGVSHQFLLSHTSLPLTMFLARSRPSPAGDMCKHISCCGTLLSSILDKKVCIMAPCNKCDHTNMRYSAFQQLHGELWRVGISTRRKLMQYLSSTGRANRGITSL